MNDQELHAYCEAWREWCRTRKYCLAPGARNILARMQPAKVGQAPDAALSPDMQYFNMAVHALADIDEAEASCFVEYYFYRTKNIKVIAAKMGISRNAFYERRDRFTRKAYSMSLSLKRVHEDSRQAEVAEVD